MDSFHLLFRIKQGQVVLPSPFLGTKRIDCGFPLFVQGFEKLQEYVDKWEGLPESSNRYNLKVFTDRETYNRVEELAKLQDKTAHQLAMDVIRDFVASQQNGKSE